MRRLELATPDRNRQPTKTRAGNRADGHAPGTEGIALLGSQPGCEGYLIGKHLQTEQTAGCKNPLSPLTCPMNIVLPQFRLVSPGN